MSGSPPVCGDDPIQETYETETGPRSQTGRSPAATRIYRSSQAAGGAIVSRLGR